LLLSSQVPVAAGDRDDHRGLGDHGVEGAKAGG
jgi:hypothetical protein